MKKIVKDSNGIPIGYGYSFWDWVGFVAVITCTVSVIATVCITLLTTTFQIL